MLSNGSEVARYKYDPVGRRVEKVAGNIATAWTYRGADILREASGASQFKYAHGPASDDPLAKEDGAGAFTYFHTDGSGSVVTTTSAVGAVVTGYGYDAFGVMTGGGAGYSYTGREWDFEAQLYYNRARYYDPAIGRFISEDPAGYGDGMNLYAYAGGNPVRYVDLSGTLQYDVNLNPHIQSFPLPTVQRLCNHPSTMGCTLVNTFTKCECVICVNGQWRPEITIKAGNTRVFVATNAKKAVSSIILHELRHVDRHAQNFPDLRDAARSWEEGRFPDKAACEYVCDMWQITALKVLRRGHGWIDFSENFIFQ